MKSTTSKPTALYCLGFTPNHDAKMLNKMAQAGSEEGKFIYIDEQDNEA